MNRRYQDLGVQRDEDQILAECLLTIADNRQNKARSRAAPIDISYKRRLRYDPFW